MAIDFPNSPTTNQIFTVGNKMWRWNGEKWVSETTAVASYYDVYDLNVLQNMETD